MVTLAVVEWQRQIIFCHSILHNYTIPIQNNGYGSPNDRPKKVNLRRLSKMSDHLHVRFLQRDGVDHPLIVLCTCSARVASSFEAGLSVYS